MNAPAEPSRADHRGRNRRTGAALWLASVAACCLALGLAPGPGDAPSPAAPPPLSAANMEAQGDGARDDAYTRQRLRMVEQQIRGRGLRDPRILAAMESVPRHLFVPAPGRNQAYGDHPLPIGHGQTISQPYIVALMSSLLDLQPGERVLEIGTGSAYHAAVLAQLAAEVYTIEIVAPLAERARDLIETLGYDNIRMRQGDGYQGWPEAAPFDAILLTAAPPEIPRPLLEQLAEGGRLVAPVGDRHQRLQVIVRTRDGYITEDGAPVRFVPMTGRAQGEDQPKQTNTPPGDLRNLPN